MARLRLHVVLIMAVLFLSYVIPVFGEVMFLNTDKPLYSQGAEIQFAGSVSQSDSQKLVHLVIHDPNGKFVLITGNTSNTEGNFIITVNASDPTQFSTKGTYSAIAFTQDESVGKTTSFDFSPDGSSVSHDQGVATSNNQVNGSQTQTMPHNSTIYRYQLNESLGVAEQPSIIPHTTTTSNLQKVPENFDLQSILYPVMAVTGAGIVVGVMYSRKKRSTKQPSRNKVHDKLLPQSRDEPESDEDYALLILKNRLAKGEITIDQFKAIKDAMAEP